MRVGYFSIFLYLPATACAASSGSSAPLPERDAAGGGSNVAIDAAPSPDAGSSIPKTCDEIESVRSYIGCEFFPTAVANSVWSEFDFAVVVANAGDSPAEIVIERLGAPAAKGTVPPGGLEKFYLPWVSELKGDTFDECGQATPLAESVRADRGAYRLTSSVPVTAYQFNALQYRGQGGPPGKSWASCPGHQQCALNQQTLGCYSFSNDASLLLPANALTGNYRVVSQVGMPNVSMSPYFAITATEDDTHVSVKLSNTGALLPGGGVGALGPGQIAELVLDRSDVIQLLGTPGSDLGGSQVQADKPVQVIAGVPCIQQPANVAACDHVEESVMPAETPGSHYFVTSPTGALGNVVGHIVKLYGNVDGTKLTYPSGAPPNAPGAIDAGQVIDLGLVTEDFELVATHELAVASFMLGGALQDPSTPPPQQKGDPSMSLITAVEQYRERYVFLAPDDYDESYADVIGKSGTAIAIDGAPAGVEPSPIGTGHSIWRVKLGPGKAGAHVLEASAPVGLQVMGYGSYTSYQYPGGSDLAAIAPPPPPVK